MSNKAIFLDRDHTLIDDPGYLSDPSAVKLLPGVELAVKSLAQAGYKLVVVTNQSGVARGLLTVETLDQIHAELRGQLAECGAHLDAIYYCPFHPEGTVEEYARESDLRKPSPGMLLKAAEDLNVDLSASWMVGDSPRDIEAGQRAGCRTVRVRTPGAPSSGDDADESAHADFTVRNLVDASRVILREAGKPASSAAKPRAIAHVEPSPKAEFAESLQRETETEDDADPQHKVRMEILQYVRQMARAESQEEFNGTKIIAGVVQVLALAALGLTIYTKYKGPEAFQDALLTGVIALFLQVAALTFFIMQRK